MSKLRQLIQLSCFEKCTEVFITSVFCMFQTFFLQVQKQFLFFYPIPQDIQKRKEKRIRSYTLKIASKIKANSVFLKPVLQNAQHIRRRNPKNIFLLLQVWNHDLQSCYEKIMSFAEFLLYFSKTSLSWQTNNEKSIL